MSRGYTFTFPALRGIQARQPYYVAMCPMRLLPRLFLFDEAEIPPELRAQRVLNTARIPEITRYILDQRDSYAFSAITASIDGEVTFCPLGEDEPNSSVGLLVVPMSAQFVINDGQHRRAAIEAALREQPDLGEETIAVVFYLDAGLERSQQLFADLNRHAVRPTKSLGVLYDTRSPLAALARTLTDQVACFRGLTEMEETTISNRSTKLFTLSAIYQATATLLAKHEGEPVRDEEAVLAQEFWSLLGQIIPEWRRAVTREVRTSDLRRNSVSVHAVLLHALGLAGRELLQRHPEDWCSRLAALGQLDWSRENTAVWEGRAMIGGHMSKSRRNVQLTATFLFGLLDMSPEPEADGSPQRCPKASDSDV